MGGFELPESYSVGIEFQVLELYERFGTMPFDPMKASPSQLAVLIAFDRVRKQQERRERQAGMVKV